MRSTTPFPNKNGNTSTEFRLLWPRLAPRCADSLCISHCRVDTQLTVPPQPPPGILSHPFKREQIFQSSDHNKTPPRIPQYQLSRCEIVLALASPSPGSVTLRALHRCKACTLAPSLGIPACHFFIHRYVCSKMKRTLAVPEERRGEKHPVPIGGCQGRRAVVANTSLSCPIDSLTILSSLPMLPLNSPTKSTPHAEHDVGLAEEGKLAGSRGPGVKSLGGNWKEAPGGGSGPNLKPAASVRMAAE